MASYNFFLFLWERVGCVMDICCHFVRCSRHMVVILLNLVFGERCDGYMELVSSVLLCHGYLQP